MLIHIIYIYVYRSFSTTLDKGLRKNTEQKPSDGEIGKHKLNEMGAHFFYEIKKNEAN